MKNLFAIAAVAGLAGASMAGGFTVYAVAPAVVNPGDTYTVEFWAEFSDARFINGTGVGTSAIAGFGLDALGTGNIAGVSTASINASLLFGSNTGVAGGGNVTGIIGGQLANLFGFLNPNINQNNPIRLFSIDVTAGAGGFITYTAGNPNVNGGLSFYPDSQDGASIVAPNDPSTSLNFIGASTFVVPAPASLALLGLGAMAARRRR